MSMLYKNESYVNLILSLRKEKNVTDQGKITQDKLAILLFCKLIEIKNPYVWILSKCARSVLDFAEKNKMVSLDAIRKNSRCFDQEAVANIIHKLLYFRVLKIDEEQQLIYLNKEDIKMRRKTNKTFGQRVAQVIKLIGYKTKKLSELSEKMNIATNYGWLIIHKMIEEGLVQKIGSNKDTTYKLTDAGLLGYHVAPKMTVHHKHTEMITGEPKEEFRNFVDSISKTIAGKFESEVEKRANEKALLIIATKFNISEPEANKFLNA